MCANPTFRIRFFLGTLLVHQVALGAKYMEKLYQDVIVPNNRRFRPLLNETDVMYVDMAVNIQSLIALSEVEQRVDVNVWVNLSWQDELRKWNPEDYGDIKIFYPEPKDAWKPRLLISNSVEDIDVFKNQHYYHYITHTGFTRWQPVGVFRLSCNMKMTYFPFDTQNCYVEIFTKYLSQQVQFKTLNDSTTNTPGFSFFSPNGEWTASSSKAKVKSLVFDTESYSRFKLNFSLKRKPAFIVLVILLPVMLLSMLSLLTFILPADSGEKVTFAITVLLSLSVFVSFISNLLPRTSEYFPLLVIYLFGLMLISTLAVIFTILDMASSDETLNLSQSVGIALESDQGMMDEHSRHLENGNISNGEQNGSMNEGHRNMSAVRRTSSHMERGANFVFLYGSRDSEGNPNSNVDMSHYGGSSATTNVSAASRHQSVYRNNKFAPRDKGTGDQNENRSAWQLANTLFKFMSSSNDKTPASGSQPSRRGQGCRCLWRVPRKDVIMFVAFTTVWVVATLTYFMYVLLH